MSIIERSLNKARLGRDADGVSERLLDSPRPDVGSDARPPEPLRSVVIDLVALREIGLLPPEHQARQIASQYRHIKRPLIAGAMGRGVPRLTNGQFIMVASGMPGEGKTFTSLNLALSMAREKDIQVLLVDADVAKPHISKLFGLTEEPGLLDALDNPSADVERLTFRTNIPNLAVLPAGAGIEHATELLASGRMATVMNELVRRHPARIVLFDSPPLLLTTESLALALVAGQIVIVVRSGQTLQQIVLDALNRLPQNASISFILNQSVAGDSGSYYYGYGSSAERPAEDERNRAEMALTQEK